MNPSALCRPELPWRLALGLFFSALALLWLTPSAQAVEPEKINVEAMTVAVDGDGLINDILLKAHYQDRTQGVENVTIRLFEDDILIFSNTTNEEGWAGIANLSDNEYLWDVIYEGSQLVHEGGRVWINSSANKGSFGAIDSYDLEGDVNDFYVQVHDEANQQDPNGYVEIYNESLTLLASGDTNQTVNAADFAFALYNMTPGYYTFYVWQREGGNLLQNGSFYSYGQGTVWFDQRELELEDLDDDGQKEKATLNYTVETSAGWKAVAVVWNITDVNNQSVHYESDSYYMLNGSLEARNLSWIADREEEFTIQVALLMLVNGSWNVTDLINFTAIKLSTVNEPPTLTVAYPAEGATLRGPANLTGSATDPQGPVNLTRVEVSLDDPDFTAPWLASGTSDWYREWETEGVEPGAYTLYFRAVDGGGLASQVVQRNVTVVANQAPSLEFTAPLIMTETEGWLVTLAWQSQDPEGDGLRVTLWAEPASGGGSRVNITSDQPANGSYLWNTSQFTMGDYRVWGEVTDSLGASDLSAAPGLVRVPLLVVNFLAPAPAGDRADRAYTVRWGVTGTAGSRTTILYLDNDTDADNGYLQILNERAQSPFQWEATELAEELYYLRVNITQGLFRVVAYSGPLRVVHYDLPQKLSNLTYTPVNPKPDVRVDFTFVVTNPGAGPARMELRYTMDGVILKAHEWYLEGYAETPASVRWTATPGRHTLVVQVTRMGQGEPDDELSLSLPEILADSRPKQQERDVEAWPLYILVPLTLFILAGGLVATGLLPVRQWLEGVDVGAGGSPPQMEAPPPPPPLEESIEFDTEADSDPDKEIEFEMESERPSQGREEG